MLGKKNDRKLTEREQVERRREEVLSRGRKFKYPLQYAKHRVAIIATIISVVAVVTLGFFTYAALYLFGSSHAVLYHTTQIFPLPVAEIAGEPVRFSDYLLLYRSSIAVVDKNTQDIETVSSEYKRSSLDSAEKYSYAIKLAKELGIETSEAEIAELFDTHRRAGGTERSEASFLKILSDNFGIDKSEYNRLLELLLIKTKVSASIDDNATRLRDAAAQAIRDQSGDLYAASEQLGDSASYEDTGGLISLGNIDGGRSAVAFGLEPGQISDPFISSSGDAYYIVKLLEKTDADLSYASIRIPFTEFDRRYAAVIADGERKEYITIETPSPSNAESPQGETDEENSQEVIEVEPQL